MNQQSQTQNFGGGQMMGGQNLGLQQGGSQVVNPQTLQRIHQNSIFNGSNQSETALGGFGQGSMMSSVGGSFGGQLPSFGGQSQSAGQMMGGQNFGMQQGGQTVNPQILQRIHQNSIFQGASQQDSPEIQRIQQNSIFGGHSQFDGAGSMQASGFGGGFMAGQLPNFGGQNQSAGQMMGGQSYGMQQGGQMVDPQTIQRIHQNSIFQGASQPDNAQVQRIQQNSIFGGHSQFDGAGSSMQASNFGGGFMAGQLPNFGGQNQSSSQMMGGQSFGMQQQGGAQMVNPQTLQRIHNNSIFQGASQPDNPQVQRIHQNSIFGGQSQFGGAGSMQASGFGGSMGAGQMSNSGGGFMAGQLPNFGGQQNQGSSQMMGGQGQQQMMNTAAFNAVLNADAGIQDNEGPSRYPASMYTGSNQYDQVNQGVLQQLANMGQASNQAFGSF